ncbi:MAG: serine protease [Candidatus Paceibacterota bacterium]|jgi:S1-C subfamily serine protease
MEDLNKNQIILLVLLISFVTSIATGIMTTSLLQEAPLEVTRNINRIVEKTIETVTIPGVTTPSQKEITTVIVKEEDMIVSSIDKNIKSIVRINEKDSVTGLVGFYGLGLVINKDGIIAADKKITVVGNTYTVKMSDGKEFSLTPIGMDKPTNFILFKVVLPEKISYVFVPTIFSDKELKLGQTLTSLGGESNNSVSVGRVVSLDTKESGTGTSTIKYITSINTDISGGNLLSGSPIFNLSGDIVGVKLSFDASKSFTPISVLKKELGILLETTKTQ